MIVIESTLHEREQPLPAVLRFKLSTRDDRDKGPDTCHFTSLWGIRVKANNSTLSWTDQHGLVVLPSLKVQFASDHLFRWHRAPPTLHVGHFGRNPICQISSLDKRLILEMTNQLLPGSAATSSGFHLGRGHARPTNGVGESRITIVLILSPRRVCLKDQENPWTRWPSGAQTLRMNLFSWCETRICQKHDGQGNLHSVLMLGYMTSLEAWVSKKIKKKKKTDPRPKAIYQIYQGKV